MKLIAKGAEASIYSLSAFGKEFVLKRRERKDYRVPELDLRLRAERTRSEARTMLRLHAIGVRVPGLIALGKFSICMEKLEGMLLKDTQKTGGIFTEVGKALALMHDNGTVHGDLTPANVMICNSLPYLIDFGLSSFTNGAEDKAMDLLLMKRAVSSRLYKSLEEAYLTNSRTGKEVILRLADVEKRGRYQNRNLE